MHTVLLSKETLVLVIRHHLIIKLMYKIKTGIG